jgi:hypothetical protein
MITSTVGEGGVFTADISQCDLVEYPTLKFTVFALRQELEQTVVMLGKV